MLPNLFNMATSVPYAHALLCCWLLAYAFVGVSSEVPKIAIFGWQFTNKLLQANQECDLRAGPDCEQRYVFSLDLIRVNRLFNPPSQSRFILLLDQEDLDANPYYKDQLRRANLEVRPRAQFRQAGSRALAYEALHAKFGLRHAAPMISRFCEWADLAKAEGITRILTVDSDVGLFDDVQKVFKLYQEDVVVPCAPCSNNVLWNVKALDKFCDAIIEFWQLPSDQLFKLVVKYNMVYQGRDAWNDMVFLQIFLHENWNHLNLTWIDLTAAWQPSERNPNPGIWVMGTTVMRANPTIMTPEGFREPKWYNQDCLHFDELFKFESTATSKIPVPIHANSGVSLPLIHFHNRCKLAVVDKVYKKYYQQLFNTMYP